MVSHSVNKYELRHYSVTWKYSHQYSHAHSSTFLSLISCRISNFWSTTLKKYGLLLWGSSIGTEERDWNAENPHFEYFTAYIRFLSKPLDPSLLLISWLFTFSRCKYRVLISVCTRKYAFYICSLETSEESLLLFQELKFFRLRKNGHVFMQFLQNSSQSTYLR